MAVLVLRAYLGLHSYANPPRFAQRFLRKSQTKNTQGRMTMAKKIQSNISYSCMMKSLGLAAFTR